MPNAPHRRLKIGRQPIKKQDPRVRIHNWQETFLGFTMESAKIEAMGWLPGPDAPRNASPQPSNRPEMRARLCPQERLCEGDCVVGYAIRPDTLEKQPPVAIGKLEAFVTDEQRRTEGWPMPEATPPTGFRVAVVGAGPAGLAVAEELAKRGHEITLFDAWSEP